VDGWAEREGKGGYRFMKLMKSKIKEKIYACLLLYRKKDFFFYIHDVITWEKQKKSSAILLLIDRQKRYCRTNYMQPEYTHSSTFALVFSHTPVLWITREAPQAQSIVMM
jgi:hypothetical protein